MKSEPLRDSDMVPYGFFDDYQDESIMGGMTVKREVLRAIVDGVKELTDPHVERIEKVEKLSEKLPEAENKIGRLEGIVDQLYDKRDKVYSELVDIKERLKGLRYVTSGEDRNVIHIDAKEPSPQNAGMLWHETRPTIESARFSQPWEWDNDNKLWLSQINMLSLYQHQMEGTDEFKNLSLYFPLPFYNRMKQSPRVKHAKIMFVQMSFFLQIEKMSNSGLPDANTIKLRQSKINYFNNNRSVALADSKQDYSEKQPGEVFLYNYATSLNDDNWLIGSERLFGITIDHGFSKIKFSRVALSVGVRFPRVDYSNIQPSRCLTTKVPEDNYQFLFS